MLAVILAFHPRKAIKISSPATSIGNSPDRNQEITHDSLTMSLPYDTITLGSLYRTLDRAPNDNSENASSLDAFMSDCHIYDFEQQEKVLSGRILLLTLRGADNYKPHYGLYNSIFLNAEFNTINAILAIIRKYTGNFTHSFHDSLTTLRGLDEYKDKTIKRYYLEDSANA